MLSLSSHGSISVRLAASYGSKAAEILKPVRFVYWSKPQTTQWQTLSVKGHVRLRLVSVCVCEVCVCLCGLWPHDACATPKYGEVYLYSFISHWTGFKKTQREQPPTQLSLVSAKKRNKNPKKNPSSTTESGRNLRQEDSKRNSLVKTGQGAITISCFLTNSSYDVVGYAPSWLSCVMFLSLGWLLSELMFFCSFCRLTSIICCLTRRHTCNLNLTHMHIELQRVSGKMTHYQWALRQNRSTAVTLFAWKSENVSRFCK